MSGWTCAYDGLKNPGFIAKGGRMMVRALCSGKVIGGCCSTIDPEDTNWLTLASVSKPSGGPVFGELKPINDGTMMQCAKSNVYRMTSAICITGVFEDEVYEVEASPGV